MIAPQGRPFLGSNKSYFLRHLFCLMYVYAFMETAPLRAAYDAGLKSGLEKGLPNACPFTVHEAMDQRFAWLSGFSVGKIVRTGKSHSP